MKRKAREQLAGNTMDDLQTALASLDEDIAPPESLDKRPSSAPIHSGEVKPKVMSGIGKIGTGKSSTLSKGQRKRLLCVLFLFSDNPQHTNFKIIQGIGAFSTPSHSSQSRFYFEPFSNNTYACTKYFNLS